MSERQRHPDATFDEAVGVCHGVLWLANNLRNYGSDAWRDLFVACVRDGRRVVGIDAEQQERPT